jgi:hypothetical protein
MIGAAPPAVPKLRFEYWPVVWLWPISLVLMQVTFVQLDGFGITLAVVICHLMQLHVLMFYWVRRPSDRQVVVALGVIAYALLLGLFASDAFQYAGSLAHIVNLIAMVLICLNARCESSHEIRRSVAVFCTLTAIAGIVIIVQAASFNLLGDFRLANPLGPLAPLGPGDEVYAASPEARLPRANGFYSEPSVAGWFMTFATALALATRRLYPLLTTLAAMICAAAAMATLSLTGVLGASIVLAGYVLFVRDRLGFKLLWLLIAGSGAGFALYGAWQLGILDRFEHIDLPGSSIYFRLNAPLTLIQESLAQFPLGYPLGQTDFIESREYYINWLEGSQTNIDNTLFKVVFYFGLLGILFNAAYLLQIVEFLLLRRHAIGLIMLSLLIGLSTTGAGWAHQFVLMIGYAILVGRYLRNHQALAPRPSRLLAQGFTRPRSAVWSAPGTAPAASPRAAVPSADGAP